MSKIEEKEKISNSQNNLMFAKKLTEGISAIDELQNKIISRRKLTTDTISTLMSDPNKNANKLQQQAELMRLCNGILREIMMYKSNLPTFDHYLIVNDINKYKTKDKLDKDYIKAITELERYNIKSFCRWNIEETIRKGEVFIYKQDGENITYFRISNELCKITHMDGMVQGYSLKLNGISDKTIGAYPTDIQVLYKKFKNGSLKNDKNFVNNYYKLSIDKAVAFSIDLYESKNAPYYSSLLMDLSRISDLNEVNMETALTENFKLIHQKLPSDKDTGEITIDFDTASMYDKAMKGELPTGVAGISTPYPITAVTLNSNTSAKTYNYLTDLKDNLYNSSGVDSNLFNSSSKSNNQAIVYSGIIDAILAFNLLDRIKIWLNNDFKNNKYLKNFRIVFCDSTLFNKDAKSQAAINNCATWNSRLEMFALQGKTPLESYNTIKMEELLGLDEYLTPLLNSHTMSGSDIADKGGRPTADKEKENPSSVGEADNSTTVK